MKKKSDQENEKQVYDSPKVMASYKKEELEDAIGIDPEVEGQTGGGCGCGCSGGSIL